jgi:hypothetical protein
VRKTKLGSDGFAIGLFAFGILLFFAPLMRMAGAITIAASGAYWLIMIGVRLLHKHR